MVEQGRIRFDVWIGDVGAVVETPLDESVGGAELVDGVVGAAKERGGVSAMEGMDGSSSSDGFYFLFVMISFLYRGVERKEEGENTFCGAEWWG